MFAVSGVSPARRLLEKTQSNQRCQRVDLNGVRVFFPEKLSFWSSLLCPPDPPAPPPAPPQHVIWFEAFLVETLVSNEKSSFEILAFSA